MVECFLAKEDVAGSTPVSRSKQSLLGYTLPNSFGRVPRPRPHEARYPSGKGEVCKTFMRRFDPDPRLQYFLKTNIRSIGAIAVVCSSEQSDRLWPVPLERPAQIPGDASGFQS